MNQARAPRIKYRFLGAEHDKPALRMPLSAHIAIGRILQSVCRRACRLTLFPRRLLSAVNSVRCTLDDWVQLEYPSTDEMPNSVFRGMYYGMSDVSVLHGDLAALLCKARAMLVTHYGEINITAQLEQLDRAIRYAERLRAKVPFPAYEVHV